MPTLAPTATDTATHCPYCAFQCGIRLGGADGVLAVSGDPDFPWMQSVVERTLHPRKRSAAAPAETPTPATGTDGTTETEDVADAPADDPGTAVSVEDACGYHPVG